MSPNTNLLASVTWGQEQVVYDYDDNANTVSTNNRSYVYDSSNQLIEVWDGANQIAGYTYNGAGQRIKKVTQSGTKIFYYDLKGHLIAETNQSGQMIAEYIYLGEKLLAMIRKPAETEIVSYFHNDHLGTPLILTNDNQTIVWKAAYTPFGGADISVQTVENPFRLPGQYYDPETGLHYNYFRYYDPTTGRYVTPDPIGLEGGINLFVYVSNRPINFVDPLGLAQAVFDGTSISLWSDEGTYLGTWPASSGRGGSVNEPWRGPIPPGLYYAEPGSTQTVSIFSPIWFFFRQESWGTQRLALIPDPNTETYGRSGFFIHGGSRKQTGGCIQIPNERSFFEAWEGTKEMLWLKVIYGRGTR